MTPLGTITLVCAALSLLVLAAFWWWRPPLSLKWRLLLFVGIAVLPTIAAGTSTADGLERTTQRDFCGSCHVMEAHLADAVHADSQSLAARHTRNDLFGQNSCYKCHADYGMNGYVLTKLGGMKHVYHYYLGGYNRMPLAEAVAHIQISAPYKNQNCMHCHAGSGKLWNRVPDHAALGQAAKDEQISCASSGCHGVAHPFSKQARKRAQQQGTDTADAAAVSEPEAGSVSAPSAQEELTAP